MRSLAWVFGSLLFVVACGGDASEAGETAHDSEVGADPGDDVDATTDGVADATASDTEPADSAGDGTSIAPDTTPDAGDFGAACEGNADRLSGYCVEGPDGYLCTRACDTTCPDGFDCRSIPGSGDVAFVCVPRLRKLCTPCADDLQCGDGACLVIDLAAACAPTCATAADCPDAFACLPDPDLRAPGRYCQPLTASCTCSAVADLGERACSAVTAAGTCFGVERCDPDLGWGACSAQSPSAELCNGLDDDCNGAIDDGLVDGAPCENRVDGVGACPGTSRCAGTPGWVCDGPVPEPETCDDHDDDCDGLTDEDFKDAAGAWTLDTSCGRCHNDCTTRFAHGLGRCAGTPEAPACVVARCDEGYVLFEGQCVPPIDTTCQPCSGDDACLGGTCLPLEGASACFMPCAPLTRACPAGLSCTAFGALERCAPSSGSCACTPALADNQRTCTRESAHGRCLGVEICQDSAWSECSAAVPTAEVCNGVDDDCDGAVDEEARWDNRGTPCVEGLGECRRSGVFVCDAADPAGPTVCSAVPVAPSEETCNGLDDDCDGHSDEDLAAPLCPQQLGVCAGARAVCAGASGFLPCNAGSYGPSYEPAERSCDQLDNDCDGLTDEVDKDGDGALDGACIGGTDCDDDDPAAHPGAAEVWDARDNDCDGLVDEGQIPVGTVIVTEIMADPTASPTLGEYFEVMNVGQSTVDLLGWVVRDLAPGGAELFTVPRSLRLAPGAFAVFCRSAALAQNGGVACDYDYGAATDLSSPTDAIVLTLAGVEIDRVAWNASYPHAAGRSLSLDPLQTTHLGNDRRGNWCATPATSLTRLTGGDHGTPGRANPSCSGTPSVHGVDPDNGIEHGGDVLSVTGSGFTAATSVKLGQLPCAAFEVLDDSHLVCTTPPHPPGLLTLSIEKGTVSGSLPGAFRVTGEAVTVITWVDLQWPKTLTAQAGQPSELIFGQVRAHGVTEAAGPPPGIGGEVGYGPLATDPRTTPGWRWSATTWNKQFFDNDEFMGALVVPTPGTVSYAFRFTDDGGINYMYGDFDPGTADGFSVTHLGTLTVEP